MPQTVQFVSMCDEMTLQYTGLKGSDGSTVVAADLAVGDVVCAYGQETDGTLRCSRPETELFAMPAFVVTAIPADCNSLPYTSQTTRRKGGSIKAIPLKTVVGTLEVKCAASQSAGAEVGLADDSFALTTIASATVNTAATQGTRKGIQLDATTSAAVVTVLFGGV